MQDLHEAYWAVVAPRGEGQAGAKIDEMFRKQEKNCMADISAKLYRVRRRSFLATTNAFVTSTAGILSGSSHMDESSQIQEAEAIRIIVRAAPTGAPRDVTLSSLQKIDFRIGGEKIKPTVVKLQRETRKRVITGTLEWVY